MHHLTSDEVQTYLDGYKTIVNLKKASRHLDRCPACVTKLKDIASISIFLESLLDRSRERREKVILRNCPDTDQLFDLAENELTAEAKTVAQNHLAKCLLCRREFEIVRDIGKIVEENVPQVRGDIQFVPKVFRHMELFSIASEQEKVLVFTGEQRHPWYKAVWEYLFPPEPVLVSFGFTDMNKKDPSIYRTFDNAQLVKACQNSDMLAWNELDQRFRNLAIYIIREHGLIREWEELWTLSMEGIKRSIGRYEERGMLKAYIARIVVRKCNQMWRIKYKDKIFMPIDKLSENETATKSYSPQDKMEHDEGEEFIKNNIKKLSEEFSSVLWLEIEEGLEDYEISERLNIKVSTVRTRKFRARVKLIEMKTTEPEFMMKIKDRKFAKRHISNNDKRK